MFGLRASVAVAAVLSTIAITTPANADVGASGAQSVRATGSELAYEGIAIHRTSPDTAVAERCERVARKAYRCRVRARKGSVRYRGTISFKSVRRCQPIPYTLRLTITGAGASERVTWREKKYVEDTTCG